MIDQIIQLDTRVPGSGCTSMAHPTWHAPRTAVTCAVLVKSCSGAGSRKAQERNLDVGGGGWWTSGLWWFIMVKMVVKRG